MQPLDSTSGQGGLGTCYTVCTMVRRVFAVVSVVGGVVAGVACASPTLPLPPPSIPSIGPGSDANHVKLSSACGGAEPDVDVIVTNENTNLPLTDQVSATRTDNCGSWSLDVYAHKGDYVDVQQISGAQTSTALRVLIQ
jgi:hypothetical protein